MVTSAKRQYFYFRSKIRRDYRLLGLDGQEVQNASSCQISLKSVKTRPSYGNFKFFKMAAVAILDFWNFKILTVGTLNSVHRQTHTHTRTYRRKTILLSVPCYHKLRGGASPVLTATGFVNRKGHFSTPTESISLNRSPKNLSQVIRSATSTAVPN